VLRLFADVLKRLRRIAEDHAAAFDSEAFVALFSMLTSELDDAYLARVDAHLRELRFDSGLKMSAWLGEGNKGERYVLGRPLARRRRSLRALLARQAPSSYTFQIAERDQAGLRALSDLREVGLALVADAMVRSCEHILDFFRLLRGECGFYISCLNLEERLGEKGGLTSFPVPLSPGTHSFATSGLFDVSLRLTVDGRVVSNDVAADGKSLVMITGANQGGKTTFLRSVGQAQLMMQCGMFVAAESFRADTSSGVFTHFKREEDATMTSGKFDEELGRMSEIVDDLAPDGLLLCNESFASTNEREGSDIARRLIGALRESGIKLVYVTHMYDLAQGLYSRDGSGALFLRAERYADGHRTFRLVEGEPLPTSYGEDVFKRIFGRDVSAAIEGQTVADDHLASSVDACARGENDGGG
jgi:DNA mismatch repair ATPase MutS